MSLTYSSTQVKIVDPINFQDLRRCEFRLDADKLYLSSLRLSGYGFLNGDANLLPGLGVLGLIKQIGVYDGNVLLDELTNPVEFLSFYSKLGGQDETFSKKAVLNKTKQNIQYNFTTPDGSQATTNGDGKFDVIGDPGSNSNNNETLIDLTQVVAMLRDVDYIPTSLFKNFRIVIEFNIDASLFTNVLTQVKRPQLIADEVVDENAKSAIMGMLMKQKKLTYFSIESEQFSVGAVADGTTQNVGNRLRNFKDKILNNMLIVKSAPSSSRRDASYYMTNEKLQVSINGKNLFGFNGLSNEALKNQILGQSWGVITQQGHRSAYFSADNGTNEIVANIGDYYGTGSYIGFGVRERVNDLQIEYERLGSSADRAGIPSGLIPLNLICYGQVVKSITFDSKGYTAKYE